MTLPSWPPPWRVVPLSGCHYEYEGQTFAFDPVVRGLTYDESELVLVVGTEDDVCEAWQSEDATACLRDVGFDTSLVAIDGGNHLTVIFHDLVDGEWLMLPDDPAGVAVVQTIARSDRGCKTLTDDVSVSHSGMSQRDWPTDSRQRDI